MDSAGEILAPEISPEAGSRRAGTAGKSHAAYCTARLIPFLAAPFPVLSVSQDLPGSLTRGLPP